MQDLFASMHQCKKTKTSSIYAQNDNKMIIKVKFCTLTELHFSVKQKVALHID